MNFIRHPYHANGATKGAKRNAPMRPCARSALPRGGGGGGRGVSTDIVRVAGHVRKVPISLQKSFWGDERNFLEPLMRFMSGDVRDHIVSSKIDQGSPLWR